jgi:hypothetical protein
MRARGVISMFRELPKNDQTISELIREFNLLNHNDYQQSIELLEKTREFLSCTSPLFSASREHLNENKVASILDAAAKTLDDYAKTLKSGGEKEKEIYDYCKATIENRLKGMESDKDKIFTYYNTHDNRLKTLLSPDHALNHKIK